MCPWRACVAVVLGLLWYSSDSGRAAAQCLLCAFFCFWAPPLIGRIGRESSGTQTDGEEAPDRPPQDCVGGQPCGCSTDEGGGSSSSSSSSRPAEPLESQYPHVKRSLQEVFECAYAQLVLPWYCVPEARELQPLYRVLSRDVGSVIDRIIERARDFDVRQAVVGSIRILTQHLHNAKQSDRQLLFGSRTEEISLLREFSDVLVRNLFPNHLWSQEVSRCALNEIVALKGLGLLVTWLSDPDNLNQLVVNQLDGVTARGSAEELSASDPDLASLASQEGEEDEEAGGVSLEGAGISTSDLTKGKRKGNKLKEGWSKFVDKLKTKKAKKKKMKKVEQELVMRIMAIQGDLSNEDDVSSREGSVDSHQDSDGEDSDLENYLTSVREDMMEFKLSYEMWRIGRWAVSIPHAEWGDGELILTVHLEEKDSPENLQWDIRKTYMDVIYFRNRWQNSTILPAVPPLEGSEISEEIKEAARVSVEHFLQELISDNVIGHTQPVFQFLCPLEKLLSEEEHYGGVWGLLSGLAYFLTPGQEEEETASPQTEAPKETVMPRPPSESTTPPVEDPRAPAEQGSDATAPTLPTIVVSQYESRSEPPEEAEAEEELQSAARSDLSNENLPHDKTEDSDNPLTSHFKMIIKGLTRSKSQESLVSSKPASSEDQPLSDSVPHCSYNGGLHGEGSEGPSRLNFRAWPSKKEKSCLKMSGGSHKAKGREHLTAAKGEDSQCQKSQVNWEQQEATKAIFDLLKEISDLNVAPEALKRFHARYYFAGNSILINIFDAILKPVMPILKKKVNSFLNKMNPTEVQMAAYIDALRDKQWPEVPAAAPSPPRTDEEKNETRERAHSLINARYSNSLVLKKTDVESVFNLFQDREENKTLLYMLLTFFFREFFPNEHSLNVRAAALQKATNSAS